MDSRSLMYSLAAKVQTNSEKKTTKLYFHTQGFAGDPFVENIPLGAFAPYFTTDMRVMTGRYYRVTVNKCGWLVEDYLNL